MKKLLQLKTMLLLCALIVGCESVWASEITYVFTSKDWNATVGDETANWTKGSSGGQLTAGQGIQVSTTYSGANGTSPRSFDNISQIVVKYCTNASKGAGTIKVQVGTGTEKSFSVTKPSSDGTTLKDATFTFNPKESGNVKITATCSTNSVYIHSVIITYEILPTSVSLNNSSLDMTIGDSETLTATVLPNDADDKSITWTSDAPGVADVHNGVVSAKGVGEATITATTTNGKTATCSVSVTASSDPTAIVSTPSLDFGEVEVGQTPYMTFTVTPSNLTDDLTISCNNAKYTVSPTSIAQDITSAQTITVTAKPTSLADEMDGVVTISGGGLLSDKEVALSASLYQVSTVTLNATNGSIKEGDVVKTTLTSRVGSSVTLTAVPDDGYYFDGWTAVGATPTSSNNEETEFTLTSATVSLTANFIVDPRKTTQIGSSEISSSTNVKTGYYKIKTIVKDGLTWVHNGFQDNTYYNMIQLRTRSHSDGVSWIKLPTFSGNIQTITFSVTSASATSKNGAGVSTTLYFQEGNTKNETAIATGSSSNSNTITINLKNLNENYSTGYITVGASTGLRIWDITVVYIPTDINVSVSSVKYATFSDHLARDFSASGITVYKAKANGSNVTLTEVAGGIVPANTGVILFSETTKNNVAIPVTSTDETLDDNELIGINEASVVTKDGEAGKTNYILSNETAGIGFYLAADDGATLAAHRAYLSTSSVSAREFLGFEEITGVKELKDSRKEALISVYNLAGQRVVQPTKGLYIVNGKKTVIK